MTRTRIQYAGNAFDVIYIAERMSDGSAKESHQMKFGAIGSSLLHRR